MPRRYHSAMTPAVLPQHVANDGIRAMHAAIADPERFACEPKVDGVRGLLVFDGDTIGDARPPW